MQNTMLSVAETADLIRKGRFLALAADEGILRQLPAGNWIGGSTPYFVGDQGGLQSRALVHVTDLAGPDSGARIVSYTSASLPRLPADAPENGYTVLIIPALSSLHLEFAAKAPEYEGMFMKPLVGWISGVSLDDLGEVTPKVADGLTGLVTEELALAIHVPLPADRIAAVRILNLFRQGPGDVIAFPQDGFIVSDCLVNGQPTNFARYVQAQGMDTTRPLVADYAGAQINVSFQAVAEGEGQVHFYAPVFAGIEYRHAAPVGDYVQEFDALVRGRQVKPPFACNCILNYLFGKLEGRRTGNFTGPVTFGEIAYQLLNQTLVYLEIVEIKAH